MQPRTAHANERFFIEATFESSLPDGAVPFAEFAGPIGPGGPVLTFWTTGASPVDDGDATRVRLVGKVPAEAPAGTYRVTHLEIRWTASMPLSWMPAPVPLDALRGDIMIAIEESAGTRQPAIPRLIEAG